MRNLVLIGGGGHCRSVIEAVESARSHQITGIVDPMYKPGDRLFNYKILGDDHIIPELVNSDTEFIVTVGQIKNNGARLQLYEMIKNAGGKLATIIASTSHISEHASIGEGTVALHFSLVNAGAKVGVNTIINSGAIVEHDCSIGDHCHISTGAAINGSVNIENNCFVGSNVVVNEGLTIGEKSVIASGSLVTKNLPGHAVYRGFPVKLPT